MRNKNPESFWIVFCDHEPELLNIKKLTMFEENKGRHFLSFPCCDILFFIIVNYRENKDDTTSCNVQATT